MECVPYSFRHRYAYVAHTKPQQDGTMRTVKQIADLMGHDPDTNLKSYARFQTKDLEKASDLAEIAWVILIPAKKNNRFATGNRISISQRRDDGLAKIKTRGKAAYKKSFKMLID